MILETNVSTTSISSSSSVPVGFDIFDVIGNMIGNSDSLSGAYFWGSVIDFLSSAWFVYAIIAYIFSIILLVLYVYASINKNLYLGLQTQKLRDQEKLYDELYRGAAKDTRLEGVLKHIDSENPNDWKLAIIEADIILDKLLKDKGFAGSSLGERLKSISPTQLGTLNDAWEAHKIRNRIAHDGVDFVLTKRIASETIAKYRLVFNEFDVV